MEEVLYLPLLEIQLMKNLLPPNRFLSVEKALQQTFHASKVDSITLLAGGYSSSQTYQILVKEKPYVLRVMGFDQDLSDRETQVYCMKKASEIDVAPHCYYANAEEGIVIVDYIASAPIKDAENFLSQIANSLKKLHAIDHFPPTHLSLFTYMDNLVSDLQKYALSDALLNSLDAYQRVKTILLPQLTTASCHNDLNSNNIMFDGEKVYLIDWEAAGQCDPFFDVATICVRSDQIILQQELEEYFLQQYFTRSLTNEEKEKLTLMKYVARCYPALHFLNFAAENNVSLLNEDSFLSAPSIQEWTQDYLSGKISLETPAEFLLYAMVQLKSA